MPHPLCCINHASPLNTLYRHTYNTAARHSPIPTVVYINILDQPSGLTKVASSEKLRQDGRLSTSWHKREECCTLKISCSRNVSAKYHTRNHLGRVIVIHTCFTISSTLHHKLSLHVLHAWVTYFHAPSLVQFWPSYTPAISFNGLVRLAHDSPPRRNCGRPTLE